MPCLYTEFLKFSDHCFIYAMQCNTSMISYLQRRFADYWKQVSILGYLEVLQTFKLFLNLTITAKYQSFPCITLLIFDGQYLYQLSLADSMEQTLPSVARLPIMCMLGIFSSNS